MNVGLSVLGICLALGLGSAGYFASQTVVNGRVAVNTATVKGLAERIVPADLAQWSIAFDDSVRSIEPPDMNALYSAVEVKEQAVLELLTEAGFSEDEITRAPLTTRNQENRNREYEYLDTTYWVSGRTEVTSKDLDAIASAAFEMADLPRRGIQLRIDQPQYLFTGLNAPKPDMLREATENARIAADEFARDAGVTVGGIQTARQGGFTIRDAGSEVSETRSREKMVRVVTTITFYLEN